MELMESEIKHPMLLQPSLLPDPPRQFEVTEGDRQLAWDVATRLADEGWARESLNRSQRQMVGSIASMLVGTPSHLAPLYTVLALGSLDLERVDPRMIDVATFTQARLAQGELLGELLSETDVDDLADMAERMGEAAGIEISDASEHLSSLHLLLSRAVATGRVQNEFMQTYAEAMRGSALIDPQELGQLWDTATSEEAQERLANEYGFASVEDCAEVLSRYRLAMLRINTIDTGSD